MSERKTSEIKLRVTPSFKAAVQLAAEQAGETMSVYIESASQNRIYMDREKRAETATINVLPEAVRNAIKGEYDVVVHPRSQFPTVHSSPVAQNPVPAKDADGSCEKNCHPWEWCECKQLRRD